MKTVTKRIMDGNSHAGFEVLATFGKEERRIASAMLKDCRVSNDTHKCGGRIWKLLEVNWGKWYVCEKCCADVSHKVDLR